MARDLLAVYACSLGHEAETSGRCACGRSRDLARWDAAPAPPPPPVLPVDVIPAAPGSLDVVLLAAGPHRSVLVTADWRVDVLDGRPGEVFPPWRREVRRG